MAQIKSVIAARRWESGDSRVPPTLVSRRNGSLSSRSTVLAPGGIEAAEWKVPWDVMKPANITLKGNEDRRVEVWCGREDRRAQVWSVGRERFVWRWLESGELVLEKESEDMGSHQIGAFLFAVGFFFLSLPCFDDWVWFCGRVLIVCCSITPRVRRLARS